MSELDPVLLESFRDAIGARLGLHFDDGKLDLLADVAAQRLEALGQPSLEAYVARLAAGADPDELRALAEKLTVGETYFFRNRNDLDAFTHVVLPARMRARDAERRLRILSAGCSSGEEPYTLAMIVRGTRALDAWDVRVRGIDVNPAAIARARAARYGEWSLRQTSPGARARFFRGERRDLRVVDEVRALVDFEERNLLEDDPALWQPGAFDVVFCRNVTMYFSPEITRRIIERIARTLAPGGFLFIGHAESLRGVSTAFHLRHTHDTFYYERREGPESAAPAQVVVPAARRPAAPPPVLPLPDGGWVEAIRSASERVQHLTAASRSGRGAPPDAGAGPAPTPGATGREPAAVALALLEQERFGEALAALGSVALDHETDADALLVRAVLLTIGGDVHDAERVCARLLVLDELNAEAHYLTALCREHARDLPGAADHDRYAAYLDPTFAMPRLHLGLMASRGGQREVARRELARARPARGGGRRARPAPRRRLPSGGAGGAVRRRAARVRRRAVSAPLPSGAPADALRAAFDDAFSRPAQAPDADAVALLALRVAGAPMAVRVLETAGLMQVRPIVPVPGRRAELLGVSGVRGALVPVYSLARLLGLPDDEPPRWLLLAATARGERIGLAVATFERHLLRPAGELRPATGAGAGEAHAPELLVVDGTARPVLSVPSLLRKITG